MKKTAIILPLVASSILLSLSTTSALAWKTEIPHNGTEAYVHATDGNIVRDRFGGCVRTIHWSDATSIDSCEGRKAEPAPMVKSEPKHAEGLLHKHEHASGQNDLNGHTHEHTHGTGKDAYTHSHMHDHVAKPKPVVAPAPKVVAPVPKPTLKISKEAIAAPLAFSGFFGTGGSNLTGQAKGKLDDYIEYLKATPGSRVKISGYTDSVGRDSFNQKLSLKRANSVKAYLSSQGVSADRIDTVGMGEENPVASNANKEGRAKNRRVELEILK